MLSSIEKNQPIDFERDAESERKLTVVLLLRVRRRYGRGLLVVRLLSEALLLEFGHEIRREQALQARKKITE